MSIAMADLIRARRIERTTINVTSKVKELHRRKKQEERRKKHRKGRAAARKLPPATVVNHQ
jgi:hypothetical protein